MFCRTVNAGKSKHNEDQSTVHLGYLTRSVTQTSTDSLAQSSTDAKNATVSTIQPSASNSEQTISQPPNSDDDNSKSVDTSSDGDNSNISPDKKNEERTALVNGDVTHEEALPHANGSDESVTPGIVTPDDGDSKETETLFNGHLQEPLPDTSETVGVTDVNEIDNLEDNLSCSPHFCNVLPNESLFVDEGSGMIGVSVPYYYFAVFDGHAGWGAAVYASQHLQHILHNSLSKVVDYIIPDQSSLKTKIYHPYFSPPPVPDVTSVVVGALEQSFYLMDKKIEQDRHKFCISGGCTACVAVFIMGKLYVANAGDSRATASVDGAPHPMSNDFTPETENYRIRKLGALHPELLGGLFNPIEFQRRPLRREVGNEALCRHPYMARGWAYKRITEEDLKCPLVTGSGKRSRVMGTIGVTRGFGDHDLKAQVSSVLIKPFLSCEPEVKVLDLISATLTDNDALILGTDGLWDITTNEKAVSLLQKSLLRSQYHLPSSDPNRHKYRYTSAAQDLVMSARGKLTEHNWRTAENKHATIDDIAVFVIPLKPYQEEHKRWKQMYDVAMESDNLPKAPKVKENKETEYKSELPITTTLTEAINNKVYIREDQTRKNSGFGLSNLFPSPGTALSAILSSSGPSGAAISKQATSNPSDGEVESNQSTSSGGNKPSDVFVLSSSEETSNIKLSLPNSPENEEEESSGGTSRNLNLGELNPLDSDYRMKGISPTPEDEKVFGRIELLSDESPLRAQSNIVPSISPDSQLDGDSTTPFGGKSEETEKPLNPLMEDYFQQDTSGHQIPRWVESLLLVLFKSLSVFKNNSFFISLAFPSLYFVEGCLLIECWLHILWKLIYWSSHFPWLYTGI